tara:strand:+ start:1110 stop:1766 length:657 start_codon:yes stop_codon:yes gene_type:complete
MKKAIIFGSSGLIGSKLLDLLIESNYYNKIKLFVRSDPKITNSKLEIIKTDFNNLEIIKSSIVGDDCFFCIGTTRKNTPNKKNYINIEHDLPIKIGEISKSNSINSFIYISSLGANSKALGLYLKNKGQVENRLKKLNFPKLSIIRPSILLGNRKENRIGEKIGIFVMQALSPLFLGKFKKYKPIKVENIAKAMLIIAKSNFTETTFESDLLLRLSKW